jgi:hypothetical protein
MSFKTFMSQVNAILIANVGVGSRDLEDFGWLEHYEDEFSPIGAVYEFLQYTGYLRRYPAQFAPLVEEYRKSA